MGGKSSSGHAAARCTYDHKTLEGVIAVEELPAWARPYRRPHQADPFAVDDSQFETDMSQFEEGGDGR